MFAFDRTTCTPNQLVSPVSSRLPSNVQLTAENVPAQKIMTKVSIGNFFALLPEHRFIRVHKSFIVARNKITAFTAMDVEIGGVEVPIGRAFREGFLEEMGKVSG